MGNRAGNRRARRSLASCPNTASGGTGTLDTAEYGGLDGVVQALRTRVPGDAGTASVPLRQGSTSAVNVTGAGLAAPGQSMWFPACVSVVGCAGTNGESISFVRKRATNVFNVKLTAWGLTFPPPLSSAGLTVTLSLGGTDNFDQANCRRFGRGKSVSCR